MSINFSLTSVSNVTFKGHNKATIRLQQEASGKKSIKISKLRRFNARQVGFIATLLSGQISNTHKMFYQIDPSKRLILSTKFCQLDTVNLAELIKFNVWIKSLQVQESRKESERTFTNYAIWIRAVWSANSRPLGPNQKLIKVSLNFPAKAQPSAGFQNKEDQLCLRTAARWCLHLEPRCFLGKFFDW